jgi:mono/diheme cytochrome c family protein
MKFSVHASLLILALFAAAAFGDGKAPDKWVAPAKAALKADPIPSNPESVKAGRKVFTNNCVPCHGAMGRGDGQLAAFLPIKPANLSNAEVWQQTDGAIFWKVSTGRQPMPTWDTSLTEEERWNVVNFLRATFAPAGLLRAAPVIATKGPLAAAAPGTPIVQVPDVEPPRETAPPRPGPTTSASNPGDAAPITREEYERLLRDQREMRTELEQFKKERAGAAGQTPVSQSDIDDIQKQITAIQTDVRERRGSDGFFLAGDAFVDYSGLHGSTSTFSAGIAPLILYKPTDNLLFETSFDLGLNTNPDTTSSTSIDLTIADASFFITDWLTIGAGVFVTPFGVYHNHFDPPWINKFADDPLPFGNNAIAPGSSLGVIARGAQLIGNSKIVYDAYITNGPNLVTADKTAAGSLAFDNWSDLNNDKTIGGRLGFIPIPNLEVGYSLMSGKANPAGGFPSTHFLLQAVDLNYRPDVPALGGTFDFRTEWIWSNVERVTYDPNGRLGFGPLNYGNYRDGGYVQLAYRPTHESNEVIRNIELVSRWDYLKIPEAAPGGGTEQRYTIGVDYWINPQAVLKFNYEFDRRSRCLGPQQSGLLIQLGLGL